MNLNTEFLEDEIFGDRLLVSVRTDQTELNDNIRVARVLLRCFDDMYIINTAADKETIKQLISDVIEKLRT